MNFSYYSKVCQKKRKKKGASVYNTNTHDGDDNLQCHN